MEVVFFQSDVRECIDALDVHMHARVYKIINLLEQFGHLLGLPQSRALGDGLFELRVKGKREIRIFYVFFQQQAILLHVFVKKSQRTPDKELHKARDRQKALTDI